MFGIWGCQFFVRKLLSVDHRGPHSFLVNYPSFSSGHKSCNHIHARITIYRNTDIPYQKSFHQHNQPNQETRHCWKLENILFQMIMRGNQRVMTFVYTLRASLCESLMLYADQMFEIYLSNTLYSTLNGLSTLPKCSVFGRCSSRELIVNITLLFSTKLAVVSN